MKTKLTVAELQNIADKKAARSFLKIAKMTILSADGAVTMAMRGMVYTMNSGWTPAHGVKAPWIVSITEA